MYIPKRFNVEDTQEIWSFLKTHSFATLVITKDGRPVATHIPVIVRKQGENLSVSGHIAYGNPQWRSWEETEEALVIFQGPHAYISSSWYEEEQVPTWNYQAVHVYGAIRQLSEAELREDLKQLMSTYEQHRKHPVLWETVTPALLEREIKGIVGFVIEATEVQAAYKMSQNRKEHDYANIIEQLKKEPDAGAEQVAQEMKRLRK
ncbi:FMN-binding negative transcriptional regulator [Chryseomicrobium palamuruense]|uniref:FMN-binding negative transcriptional regulator n=1 Tax=Chryseomicrobium palamuruense TaxID=682973 RepID=A0ABV8UR40_9BACL